MRIAVTLDDSTAEALACYADELPAPTATDDAAELLIRTTLQDKGYL